ncbi:MAG: FAD-dependent oxidoreductase [Vicinamibacterales bacterium]|nr:FAD-dependent oxidoreductase [Vicinamibacterales bacterium]
MRRRELLKFIGATAGSSVMYQVMATLGLAASSTYEGPIRLDGDPRGASVLILGAGLAGMVAALELRKAGYKVQILEYQNRAGGRCWSIRGGDRYTELGGFEQKCEFDKGLYLNPGPWRIPSYHRGVLDYCRRLGVALEPFTQVNYNAFYHAKNAFGGKPQRFRHLKADFQGGLAELLAKATSQDALDASVTSADKEVLLQALQQWGALDKNYAYKAGPEPSSRRGYERDPGGGLNGEPTDSEPLAFTEILRSRIWERLADGDQYIHHTAIFQPVGGMDMIAKAFAHEVGDLVRYGAKVTAIKQDEKRVTVNFLDSKNGGTPATASADWCLCTIPLSVLSQIDMNVGAPMARAIGSVPYTSAFKVGLQFKRRFWEQDDLIFGGISYTDLPIGLISYPSTSYGSPGKGVLLGGYIFGVHAYEFTSLSPQERIAKALECGAQIHPQYSHEFENGFSVAWHRVPWTLGCSGAWTPETRRDHYRSLCAIDGRILLAGEHASYIPAWMEGAVLSSLDAIARLHKRVLAGVVLGVCLLAMTVSAAVAQTTDGSFSNRLRFMPKDGGVLYRTSCQACHMPAGEGATGAGRYPALANNARLRSARYTLSIVLKGSRAMPPFREQLDDEQVAAVVNYMRTHFGNDYRDSISAADVKAAAE